MLIRNSAVLSFALAVGAVGLSASASAAVEAPAEAPAVLIVMDGSG